jgi:Tfp pilus assembly protein PilV
MVAVVVFVIGFLGLWTVAARQISSMLRVEQARAKRIARDAAALASRQALAQALAALESGYPPANPYVCLVTAGSTEFAVTYQINPDSEDPSDWLVTASTTVDPGLPALDPAEFEATPPM